MHNFLKIIFVTFVVSDSHSRNNISVSALILSWVVLNKALVRSGESFDCLTITARTTMHKAETFFDNVCTKIVDDKKAFFF